MFSHSSSTGSSFAAVIAVLSEIAFFSPVGIEIMTGTMIETTMTGIMIENVEEHGTGTETEIGTRIGTGRGTETVTA